MFSMSFTIMQHIHIMHSFDMSAIAGEKQVRCIWGRDIRPFTIEMFFLLYYIYQHTGVKSQILSDSLKEQTAKQYNRSSNSTIFWPTKKNLSNFRKLNKLFSLL